MKILNFGSCNIDYVYQVEHIVRPGETSPTQNLNLFAGGKGLNQSVAAARAGAKTYHAGCIGFDGGMLRDILIRSGVNIDYLMQKDSQNGHAIIQVDNKGENSILVHKGTNGLLAKEDIDRILAAFDNQTLVMLQNEMSNTAYIMEAAKKRGLRVMFNPAPFSQDLEEIDLKLVDFLILNRTESLFLLKTNDAETINTLIKEKYPHLTVLLTLGKDGAIVIQKDAFFTMPAFCVSAVDTTAAGDTFAGYFTAGLSSNTNLRQCILQATAAAAICVGKPGAAPSIPTMDEVLVFLKNHC